MSSKHRYLLNRDGRYFARIVIPKPLRPFLENKSELREPLGPDRRTAIARLATAVSALQGRVAVAERKAQIASGAPITPGRYPLSADQMALRNYNERIAFDLELRNATDAYAQVSIDDRMVELLREGVAGRLDNQTLQTLVGERIERFRRLGNTTVVFGSPEWRTLARALCISELEALGRAMERDEGDFTGKPEHPELAKAVEEEEAEDSAPTAEFNALTFEAIVAEQVRLTKMGLGGNELSASTLKKYRRIIHDFEHHRRSKRAATVTLEEGEAWRNAMLAEGKISRKSIRDKLAAIRAILTWGQKQHRGKLFPDTPKGTPFDFLELPNVEVKDSATRTYTLKQARTVLDAARAETDRTNFRWVPWLLAYTGMRVGEALQLERADIFELQGYWFINVRVGEGRTTKTKRGRKIPVHQVLVDEGFIAFVQSRPDGLLFPGTFQDQRLREWMHSGPLKGEADAPPPNHGFRHLFEDALFSDVSQKAALYITGRSSGSSADGYGGSDLKLLELAAQMKKVRLVI
ncbi:tyrosine-type recombinase/integrase [Martelella mediterranea]|uniref:site-specific integrase n=1 Tax=Martelella mediterranea TaxID=293089 RepID=UPI001E300403|nr:tyrosine-type recombinase/integrase [Martelella mediterranea]MCD1634557.1 tyrosine-type recombinase/integrase [Martelella mediterranea]